MTWDLREVAQAYDAIADRIGMSEEFYRHCLQLVERLPAVFLDVGCGQGTLLALARKWHGTRGVGIDLSGELCRRARERNPGRTLQGDAHRLPFASGSFELVTMTEVLEHLPRPEDALGEIRRVLAPGGLLLLSVPNRSWLRYPLYLRERTRYQPVDDRWYRPKELYALLQSAGFSVLRADGFGCILGGRLLTRAFEALLVRCAPSFRTRRKRLCVLARRE